ncbi:hypothetical protein OSB04_024325 [Centaurea solstitialis]|uniref:Polyprotein n=1 Tax=Centaurea solstitialis TaxID=347529 RepID=A0AA38SLI8_9ASTR|nr:hypothetical protein OSB04_024325 [Centaurea solstitialis]
MVPDQEHAGDALFINVNSSATPTCTYVPRQLSREELLKLLPEKWITNNEQIHQAPVQTMTTPEFIRHENGQVEVRFSSQEKKSVFPTTYMVLPLQSPIPAKGTEHCQYDICDCHDCLEEAYKIKYGEDIPKKKRSQQKLKERYESGDPTIRLLGEPSGNPFEFTQQRTKHDWKIKTATTIGPTGIPTQIGPAECTINWQSENVVALNKALKMMLEQQAKSLQMQETLVSKVQSLEDIIDEIRVRIQGAYYEDTFMVASSNPPTVLPIQKAHPISSFLKSLTREESLPKPPCIAPVIATSSHVDNDLAEAFEHMFMIEPETTAPIDEDDDYEPEDETWRIMPQRRTTKAPKGDFKQMFTFDDIPPSQWRDRSMEMLTWCTARLQHYYIEIVIKRFLTRIQGRLRDWYISLGEYRQMQLLQSPSPKALLHTIYAELIGNPIEHTVRAREEFLKMKCCSFRMKDLETHYNNMSKRFYCLNDIDDTNLKQLVINSLQKLFNQKKFLAEFERTGKQLGSVCDDRHLQIKCKNNSSCECSNKKKSHFRKIHSSSKKAFTRKNLRKKKWKFTRKKSHKGRITDRCFICNKKGHFAKDYRNKKSSQALIQALNQIEPVDISDLESPYSLDDEPSDEALCTIIYSDPSLDEESNLSIHVRLPYTIQPRSLVATPLVLPLLRPQPSPLARVYILISIFAKPIPVIAFFYTGSSVSILNPDILSSDYWRSHHQHFIAANGDTFVIDKINIPIYVRLFTKCQTQILGSSSHGKDLLIGFDILHTLPKIRFAEDGLRYKSFLNPWSLIHRLYMASTINIEVMKQQIIQTSRASSHTDFLMKNKNPLWLNPLFFVSLPFKQNKDFNPTKVSHPGMNPDHYQLAVKECSKRVEQNIIEPPNEF